MRVSFNILALAIVYSGFSCKNKDEVQISNLVESYVAHENFNGLIKVYKNNRVIYNKTYGYADFTTKRKLTPGTPFRIGSVSKTFTAVSVLILKGRGRLQLPDTVGKFIRYLPDSYLKVTIEELLTHTSEYLTIWRINLQIIPLKEFFRYN